MVGALTACLALGGLNASGALVMGQTPPPEAGEVDLNAMPTVVNGRISRPTLQPGSQGEAVTELQSVLFLLGYYSGPVSGVFQADTQAAVQQFQADAGINPDGIVGPATWSSLFPTPPTEANPPGTASVPTANPEATPGAPSGTGSTQPNPDQVATSPEPNTSAAAETSSPTAETPSAPATTIPANRPLLRLGAEGEAVRQLQERLNSLGFYNGPIDGIFGPQTETAVEQAQTANNLTVDGVVGQATWNALE